MYSKDDNNKVSRPSSPMFIQEYVNSLGLSTPEDIKRQTWVVLGVTEAARLFRRGK